MTDVYSNSPRQVQKNVILDPGSAAGPYEFTLFPRTLTELTDRDNSQIALTANTESLQIITITPDVGHTILDPISLLPVSSLVLYLQGQTAEFVFYKNLLQWVVKIAPDAVYIELWQATPILDLTPGVVIQWTFVPLFPGQVSSVFTEAAGVFTYNLINQRPIEIAFDEESSMHLLGNNQDVTWDYTETFVGAGLEFFPRIIDAFAHARTAVFLRSGGTSGSIVMSNGDTFLITGTSAGAGGAFVGLDAGVLVFKLDL